MLNACYNSKAVKMLVKSAAAQKFGRGKASPVFEHGQWWVLVDGRTYAVVDSVPGINETGLDFEEV